MNGRQPPVERPPTLPQSSTDRPPNRALHHCQDDQGNIRAIDLEFTTVYYAAHNLAYAMGGCCIRGAEAKRTFLRAYIEELSGKAATAEEVDSLAIDALLFSLPMHNGP